MFQRLSMRFLSLLGFIWLTLTLTACSFDQYRWSSQYYRVRQGDTLYAIAWRYRLDYQDLARWNGIPPPYRIYPEQRLLLVDPQTLPSDWRPASTTAKSQQKRTTPPAATGSAAKAARSKQPSQIEQPPPSQFHWPTAGAVTQKFAATKGINIAGKFGQPVFASAAGKVVYSGNGLIGYGPLLIIKHNDTYLSAYAHNSKLLVREGEQVKLGQKIAEMGETDQNIVQLHFEIRKQGKPVDPLKYLPKR